MNKDVEAAYARILLNHDWTLDGCLIYLGKANRGRCPITGDVVESNGHKKIRLKRDGKWVLEYVHRVSYMFHFGAIPEGMKILHSCDVPACFFKDHLSLGTQADNMRDCARKGRNPSQVKAAARQAKEKEFEECPF